MARVRAALEGVPGVTGVSIDFENKMATVQAEGVESAVLLKAVDEAGDYSAKVKP